MSRRIEIAPALLAILAAGCTYKPPDAGPRTMFMRPLNHCLTHCRTTVIVVGDDAPATSIEGVEKSGKTGLALEVLPPQTATEPK